MVVAGESVPSAASRVGRPTPGIQPSGVSEGLAMPSGETPHVFGLFFGQNCAPAFVGNDLARAREPHPITEDVVLAAQELVGTRKRLQLNQLADPLELALGIAAEILVPHPHSPVGRQLPEEPLGLGAATVPVTRRVADVGDATSTLGPILDDVLHAAYHDLLDLVAEGRRSI